MSKYNADEQTFEPIEITLDGESYTITAISNDMLTKIQELQQEKSMDTPIKQLAVLLGVEASKFADTDLRKVAGVLKFVMDVLEKGVTAPNPTGPVPPIS